MKHYEYLATLKIIWEKAVELYEGGQRGSDSFFSKEESEFLSANGITAQEIYDFVEDFVVSEEPDFATFATVSDVRRYYFLERMGGKPTGKSVDPATYPAKTEEVDGIVWLPRIIEKAKTKLRGELDLDTMYGCGGDRRFFKTNNIHPAEFLRVVMDNEGDDAAVIAWVKKRRSTS